MDTPTGRVMVDITLRGSVEMKEMRATLARRIPSFSVTAVDLNYRGVGIIEGLPPKEATSLR